MLFITIKSKKYDRVNFNNKTNSRFENKSFNKADYFKIKLQKNKSKSVQFTD